MIRKRATASEKVLLESCDHNSQISPNNFSNNNFFQPNVHSIESFNANFKKQRESVANQISNKAKNINYNLDIEELISLRKLHTNNPIIGYLNINSHKNKITQLREVCRKAPIDVLCTCYETKLDVSFPDAQFYIEGCQYPPFRRDRDKNGGRKMIFIRQSLIVKRLYTYEDSTSETVCLEVTISKKKWCVAFAYRPPYNSSKDGFFKELNKSLSNITRKYENVLIFGDLNIDILDKKKDSKNYLSDLCDTFSPLNLISEATCVKSSVGSSIDVMLINRPRSFHHTSFIETGMSDCHKLILSLFRAFFKRIPAKTIECRNFSKFSPEAFLHELDQELNKGIIYNNQDKQYDLFSDILRTILDHHAPLKTKSIRGNQAKFMTKELSKLRSRFKNRYLKWSSRENFLAYKKAKNLCNSLNRKAKKTYFEKATENGVMGSKKFWSTVNPFLSSKGFTHNNDIKIEIDNKIIEDESKLAKTFNSHYINIVKSTTGMHPTKLGTLASRISEREIVATFIEKFKNHPSIVSIRNEFRPPAELNFKAATVD